MSSKKSRYGQRFNYKRRSQVYDKLRSKRLSSGEYLVVHEPTATTFYVFKRQHEEDWVVRVDMGKGKDRLIGGFRTKNKAMETLAKEGPRTLRTA